MSILKFNKNVKTKSEESDEIYGCGISWIYMTGPNDPFHESCVLHDRAYDNPQAIIKNEDWEFFKRNINIAVIRHSHWLVVKAYGYFLLARLWAKLKRRK